MKNSDYWKIRFEQLEDERYIQTEKFCKDLEKQFRKAQLELQSDIEKWYWRLADNNEISYAEAKKLLKKSELEEFKWNVEDYIKYGQENSIDQKWMKQLENASARVHISRLEAIKIQMRQQAERIFALYEGDTSEFLKSIYENGFYKTAFSVAKGSGVASELVKLNPSMIETVIMKPWAQDGKNFSERIWTNKEKLVNMLHTELTQNVLRGTSPEKAAKAIAEQMGVSARQARTLVYTESAAIASKAQQDCFNELDLEQYEILATLDSRTSDICREMDKKVFEMKDYQVGVTAPPFHPRCRSCTCPYFDDEFTLYEYRASKNTQTGKTNYFPANMTYSEWKKRYLVSEDSIKQKKLIEKKYKNAIMNTKKELGIRGSINLNPTPIDLTDFEFDEVHINSERKHNVDRKAAEYFMKRAGFTLERWNGQYVNYYSESGAVYIDVKNKKIRTAFRNKEFDSKIRKLIEVIINGRYN